MIDISPALFLDPLWEDARLTGPLDILTDRARSPNRGLMFGYVPHRGNLLPYGPPRILSDLGGVVHVSEEMPEDDDLALAAGRLGQAAMASETISALVSDILGDGTAAYGLEVVLFRHAAIVFAEDPWEVTETYPGDGIEESRLRRDHICSVALRPAASAHERLARIEGVSEDWEAFANLQDVALQILESGGRGRLAAPAPAGILALLSPPAGLAVA